MNDEQAVNEFFIEHDPKLATDLGIKSRDTYYEEQKEAWDEEFENPHGFVIDHDERDEYYYPGKMFFNHKEDSYTTLVPNLIYPSNTTLGGRYAR